MSWFRSILDAAMEGTARTALRVLGRDVSADEDHLLPQGDRDTAVNRCHDLRRNNPVAAGALQALLDNVIGPRVVMQARTSDAAWNDAAEQWFRRWSGMAETSGREDFAGILGQCVNARLFDGELLLVPHVSGSITLVESERVRDGGPDKPAYQLDKDGRVTSWRVCDRNAGGEFSADGVAHNVRDAIHVAYRTRPDQVRGWPQLATVANICADIGEINAANLKKYKMGALAAWTLTGGGQLRGRNGHSGGTPLAQFRDGMIYELEQGQTLQPFSNNQPGGEYAPFVKLNLQLVSTALRLPYEFLLMYFGDSNFASSRTALLQAAKTIGSWQSWLERSAIRPMMAWRVAQAIADGELPPAPVDADGRSEWDRWEWMRPALDWIDPQSAIQAEQQELRLGVTSLSEVVAAHGRDLDETLRRKARDLALVRKIAAEYGVPAEQLYDNQISGQTPLMPVDAAAEPAASLEDMQ